MSRSASRSVPVHAVFALLVALVGARSAAAQEPLFRTPVVTFGVQPDFVVAGDLDLDGDADLVAATTAHTFVVALQTVPGTFAVQPGVATGSNLGALALGDLNGDASLDLAYVVDSQTTDVLVVRLGDGAGGFGNAMFSLVAAGPSDLALSDLDADGDLDAVVPGVASARVSILLGNGNGTFAPEAQYGAGNLPLRVAVGDWNGDALPDLAVTNNTATPGPFTVSVLLNLGAGTFGTPTALALPAQVLDVAAGDFDADGDADLAVSPTGSGSIQAVLGNGDGSFAAAQGVPGFGSARALQVADLDEDGDDDIAAVSGLTSTTLVGVLLSNGDGTFAFSSSHGTFGTPVELLAHDVTGDGDLDLLAPGSDFFFGQSVTVLAGNGRGAFGPHHAIGGDNSSDVAFGDFDADGRLDLVSGSALNEKLSILPAQGNGVFAGNVVLSVDPPEGGDNRPISVAAGDIDGDGHVDVIAGVNAFPARIDLFPGNGDFTFDPRVPMLVSGVPRDVQAVDLDADGDLDVLATGGSTNTLMILRNVGGVLATPDLYATATQPVRLDTADMDGDGILDVVVTTGDATMACFVHVYLGVGDGTVLEALSFAGGNNHGGIAAGDLDGDGDADVAVTQQQAGNVLVMHNDGTGFLSVPTAMSATMQSLSGIEVADFDGDEVNDIVASGSSQVTVAGFGGLCFFKGTGSGFAPVVRFDASTGAEDLTAADIDGDGVLDVAIPTFFDWVELFLNQTGPWNDLGHPLAGTQGLPRQVGEGTLQSLAPFRFALSDALPSAPVAHVVGLSTLNAPFKGGVFVPLPLLINFPLLTDAAGDLLLAGPWPPGAGGLTLYFQFWLQDPAGPVGFAASNALSADIPLP